MRSRQALPDRVVRVIEAECSLTAVGLAAYVEFRRPGGIPVTAGEVVGFDEPGVLEALAELLDAGQLVETDAGALVLSDYDEDDQHGEDGSGR